MRSPRSGSQEARHDKPCMSGVVVICVHCRSAEVLDLISFFGLSYVGHGVQCSPLLLSWALTHQAQRTASPPKARMNGSSHGRRLLPISAKTSEPRNGTKRGTDYPSIVKIKQEPFMPSNRNWMRGVIPRRARKLRRAFRTRLTRT